MNKSVFVGVITILLIVSIYSSSFTFDVSNAVPESSEIECYPVSNQSEFTMCCQESWDGEIIDSWIKTCTTCDAEGNCFSYDSNTLSPESTPPKPTAPKDIGDGDNIGILDESAISNPKNNDAAGNVGILDKSATISTPNPKDNDVNNQNDDKGLEQQETSSNSNDGNVSLD